MGRRMVAQLSRAYVGEGYATTVRRLVSYALFEGRPHTTRGQWFNPVVRAFLGVLRSFPARAEVCAPIFVTGMGRSGTTLLGLVLSLHRDVGFPNEPKLMWSMIDPRHDVSDDYSEGLGQFAMGCSDVTPTARETAIRLYAN